MRICFVGWVNNNDDKMIMGWLWDRERIVMKKYWDDEKMIIDNLFSWVSWEFVKLRVCWVEWVEKLLSCLNWVESLLSWLSLKFVELRVCWVGWVNNDDDKIIMRWLWDGERIVMRK